MKDDLRGAGDWSLDGGLLHPGHKAEIVMSATRKSPGVASPTQDVGVPAPPLNAPDHRSRPSSSEWGAVCHLDDIVPNTGVCALVGDRQIAVFRLDDDTVYAIDNLDPFSRANVLSRGIVGDLKGELVVASPVYKQHFSLVSGQCQEDPDVRVAVFPARTEGDTVLVLA